MSALITGSTFQHDVFVSYAHVDNPTFGQDKGWVERLVGHLRELLPQKLQRDEPDIWFDARLPGHEPFPERIREAVTHAATLLVILSENYFSSDWCHQELESFLNAADRTGGASGRIFLVRVDALDPAQRPEALQALLGYEFFIQDANNQRPYLLGSPATDDRVNRQQFFRRLDDLRYDLAEQLLQMKGTMQAQEEQAPESDDHQPTIFLAEVTPDLEETRDNIRRHLKQMNFRVLPETLYNRAPEDYQRTADADLGQSLVFVQILGPFVTAKTPDLPKGYEGLQLDLAEARELPILRWHSPDLDPNSFSDLELLHRADIMVMALEEFKLKVINEVKQRTMLAKRRTKCLDETFILLTDNSPQHQGSEAIQSLLDEQNIYYDIADEDESIEVLVEEFLFHGLVIVYDRNESPWAKQQLRICRKLMLQKGRDAPAVCVVYTVPPDEAPNLGIRLPNMRHLSFNDHAGLSEFLADVQTRVDAS